ncbi:ATP-dependent DNA helicase PIF1 [Colletotrichum musicola]|uniref:ATP-dependent DNA helicase PIF1 n=1 Tax=Colletotrichum musicola TaxID=2175873 RepID=A0A8H6IPQ5_9PEZI|nr:ATP-dependent DNA helicase PIF1 [Colletotrichum musicola]
MTEEVVYGSVEEEVEALMSRYGVYPGPPKKRYYAVWGGYTLGIFNNWTQCKPSVVGYRGADYEGADTYEGALKLLREGFTANVTIKHRDRNQRLNNSVGNNGNRSSGGFSGGTSSGSGGGHREGNHGNNREGTQGINHEGSQASNDNLLHSIRVQVIQLTNAVEAGDVQLFVAASGAARNGSTNDDALDIIRNIQNQLLWLTTRGNGHAQVVTTDSNVANPNAATASHEAPSSAQYGSSAVSSVASSQESILSTPFGSSPVPLVASSQSSAASDAKDSTEGFVKSNSSVRRDRVLGRGSRIQRKGQLIVRKRWGRKT